MDLAEIRKKARGDAKTALPSRDERAENHPARRPAAVSPAAPPTPAPASTGDSLPQVSVPPGGAALNQEEALEALFRAPLDDGALAEGNDLQYLHRPEAEMDVNVRQLLTFSIGNEEYALDIESIREIIKPREITDIPRVPDFILGIISLRGIIIPVFDLKRRLKLGTGEMKPTSRIIVCQQEEKIIGMLVDAISQVIRIPANSIEPPPAVLSGIDRDMVEGVGRYQGRMTVLLRLSCVMDAELI